MKYLDSAPMTFTPARKGQEHVARIVFRCGHSVDVEVSDIYEEWKLQDEAKRCDCFSCNEETLRTRESD